MGNIRVAGLATAVVLLAASSQQYKPFTPVSRPAPDNVFARAQRALVARGETIETKDEDAGLIVTGWKESPDSDGGARRQRWTVTVDGGTVVVNSQCEFRMKEDLFVDGSWQSCGDKQPGDRQEKAEALANEIAGQ